MLLDAEGDGEDDVAFLSGIKDIDLNKYIDRKTRKCLSTSQVYPRCVSTHK